jgi:hypothetical protein
VFCTNVHFFASVLPPAPDRNAEQEHKVAGEQDEEVCQHATGHRRFQIEDPGRHLGADRFATHSERWIYLNPLEINWKDIIFGCTAKGPELKLIAICVLKWV